MFYRFSIAPTAILSHLANLNLQKECYTNTKPGKCKQTGMENICDSALKIVNMNK